MAGPDFSAIDSEEKAEAMSRRGELEPLLLLPREFGGEECRENTVFVPRGLADAKRRVDLGVILPLVQDGKVERYAATPEYQGASFIPVSIKIVATGTTTFTTTINIWGDALTQGSHT